MLHEGHEMRLIEDHVHELQQWRRHVQRIDYMFAVHAVWLSAVPL